jgi:polysaccharide export outer membrane protein
VIDRAGGLVGGASRRRIVLHHSDGKSSTADLVRYGLTGDTSDNPFLLDGDVVEVPFEQVTASIEGGVPRPGTYELTGKRDLTELLFLGGGLSSVATKSLPMMLIERHSDGVSKGRALRDDEQNLELHSGDDVVVPTLYDLQKTVLVTGAITGSTPNDEASMPLKRLAFVEGDTVRALLQRAGGPMPFADLKRAALLHQDGVAVDVDLQALLVDRQPDADKKVAAGDTLIVPFARRSVLVEGAVFRSGSYPYNPRFSVAEYVAAAGGPTRNARDLSEARLMNSAGESLPYREGMQVRPGDVIVVPEREFSRPEIVQLVLAALGIMLSGAALLLAARN